MIQVPDPQDLLLEYEKTSNNNLLCEYAITAKDEVESEFITKHQIGQLITRDDVAAIDNYFKEVRKCTIEKACERESELNEKNKKTEIDEDDGIFSGNHLSLSEDITQLYEKMLSLEGDTHEKNTAVERLLTIMTSLSDVVEESFSMPIPSSISVDATSTIKSLLNRKLISRHASKRQQLRDITRDSIGVAQGLLLLCKSVCDSYSKTHSEMLSMTKSLISDITVIDIPIVDSQSTFSIEDALQKRISLLEQLVVDTKREVQKLKRKIFVLETTSARQSTASRHTTSCLLRELCHLKHINNIAVPDEASQILALSSSPVTALDEALEPISDHVKGVLSQLNKKWDSRVADITKLHARKILKASQESNRRLCVVEDAWRETLRKEVNNGATFVWNLAVKYREAFENSQQAWEHTMNTNKQEFIEEKEKVLRQVEELKTELKTERERDPEIIISPLLDHPGCEYNNDDDNNEKQSTLLSIIKKSLNCFKQISKALRQHKRHGIQKSIAIADGAVSNICKVLLSGTLMGSSWEDTENVVFQHVGTSGSDFNKAAKRFLNLNSEGDTVNQFVETSEVKKTITRTRRVPTVVQLTKILPGQAVAVEKSSRRSKCTSMGKTSSNKTPISNNKSEDISCSPSVYTITEPIALDSEPMKCTIGWMTCSR